MAHRLWCGRPCCDCTAPCKLDESIPCGPDCKNLKPDGSRKEKACIAAGCDAIKR